MRKNPLYAIISLFVASLSLSSCLDDDDNNYELSPDAFISSFAIGNIETKVPGKTSANKDTTYTRTVQGADYAFSIDQLNNRIYNTDSLPAGTDVSKVVTTLQMMGYYAAYEKNGKDTLWTSSDSIDFRKPVQFKAFALDGTARPYMVELRVHTVDPDSLSWTRMEGANLPLRVANHKAVFFQNKMHIFAQYGNDGMQVMTSTDGLAWDVHTLADANLDVASVLVWGGKLCMLGREDGRIYTSADGLAWAASQSPLVFDRLLACSAANQSLYALSAATATNGVEQRTLYASTDGMTWTESATVGANFPVDNLTFASMPLASNPSIEKLVVVGTTQQNDTLASVWTKLSNQEGWIYTDLSNESNKKYRLPKLKKLATVCFNNELYAFGGENDYTTTSRIPGFQSIYLSNDQGRSWKAQTAKVMFPVVAERKDEFNPPREFLGRPAEFSYLVDDQNYLWLFWNANRAVQQPEVWRGRINRLGFGL